MVLIFNFLLIEIMEMMYFNNFNVIIEKILQEIECVYFSNLHFNIIIETK